MDPLSGVRLQLGVADQGEEAVVTSIYPREPGDERHLRIMAQVLTTRSTARALRRIPLGAALEGEDTANIDLFLASQFLPSADESRSLYADPERLFGWRYEMVEEYLVSEGLARYLEFDGA